MNISEIFIRRPIATTLVMLAIVVFGVMAYQLLPVSDLPSVDYPTINVRANLPGANPDTMAASVALPLEKQFSTIPGLDSMSSNSTLGSTSLTLQFSLDRNIDGAALDVQTAISQVARQLPQEMPAPPSFSKVNPADSPILFLALGSDTLPMPQVDEYAETLLAQNVSMVSGVAQVQVFGGQKFAVHVQLDPQALASRQVDISEVVQSLDQGNVNMPTGSLWGHQQSLNVLASGRLYKAADYAPLIVTYRNGSPVRVSDLGRVVDSVENERVAQWYNSRPSIQLQIFRQPGTNTVEVVDRIKAMLPRLETQLPPSVQLSLLNDRSISIRNSLNDVKFTLELALCLVILAIFIFLRNFYATVIPSLALPFSIIGTFAVMYLCGYSLDNLSMMALTLSVGFVVDDAIVMLENIVRHVEAGEGRFEAALNGSREISFTILSMTLSLTAVFLPVLFMGGVLGRLLHEFAVSIMSAILVSGFVSLTLTPMLCSRILRAAHDTKHGSMFNFFERVQDRMTNTYDRWLQVALRHRLTTMTIAALLLAGTVYLYMVTPKGFIGSSDIDQIMGSTEAIQGVSFEVMRQHQLQVQDIIQHDPNVEYVTGGIGGGMSGGMNRGQLNIHLIPRAQRQHVDLVMQELRTKLAAVPGIVVYLRNNPPITIGGIGSRALYQFTLQGHQTDELYAAAADFQQKMSGLPGLTDVNSDVQMKNPQVSVSFDRDKASALGINITQMEDTMYSAFGQRQVSTIFTSDNQYRVILEVMPDFQRTADSIGSLYVRSRTGQLVQLRTVARLDNTLGPLAVNHLGQVPAVTISFNLKPGFAIGDAVDEITGLARQTLPSTVTASFQGSAQAFQSSLAGLGLLVVMAIMVIYIVLGVLYESFVHPITILSGLPSAGFGALLSLELFHLAAKNGWISPTLDLNLDLYGFVGIIMLIGIVKKNAIMMIDFALEAQRKHGKSPAQAIYEGCLVRFRPIMMTTMAALMGTLPIALALGAGAESRRSLCVAVVGCLIFSQFVTLFLTPVVYIYLENAKDWVAGLGRRRVPAVEPASVDGRTVPGHS